MIMPVEQTTCFDPPPLLRHSPESTGHERGKRSQLDLIELFACAHTLAGGGEVTSAAAYKRLALAVGRFASK